MNIKNLLTDAATRLNSPEAVIEARLLLQHTLNVNRAWLIAHEDKVLEPNLHDAFETLLQRRILGEPIAYILGSREFFGLTLIVTADTLIPRPDTEVLVEAALDKMPLSSQPSPASVLGSFSVLDLGTGTGAIALAIAKNRPYAQVTAVDASVAALQVAIKNAQNLNLSNVQLVHSNWFDTLSHQRFDVIVSNPPYIETADVHLSQGDLRFEPISALASGSDGLDDIRQIIDGSLIRLKPQGWLLLEHGYNQAQQVQDLLSHAGFTEITTIQDLGGNDRVTMGKNPLIVSTHWA